MEKENTSESALKPSEKNSENETIKPKGNDATTNDFSYNPSVHPDGGDHIDEDLTRMRGDAIGSTLYSERFVLSTLLKLTKVEKELAQNESFESDLCSVWDMTIEKDVVLLLLEHNVLDLFAHCINITEDKRLVEILVGILGNLCNFTDARNALVEDTTLIQTLLGLTGCSDSLTLLQLTRLFSVVFIHADRSAALKWYQHICFCPEFVKNITFILSNSFNEHLLRQTVETLNAILAKFALVEHDTQTEKGKDSKSVQPLPTFEQLFVNEALIKATTEAFTALLPRNDTTELQENEDDDDEITILPTQNTHNVMQIFLNIHCILTQYGDHSQSSYKPHTESLMHCLSYILEPLCNPKHIQHLSNREQDLLDSINDIFESLGDPFDERCLTYAIRIWNLIREENERIARRKPANDFEDNAIKDDDFNFESNYLTLLDLIVRMINAATEIQLENVLKDTDNNMKNLQNTLCVDDNNQPRKTCYNKIKNILENLEQD
ncbi:uncharacterized protein LOC128866890 [Anastrepha ludens]|uniref:uncharacterized protein LOC128866890 n=1 Tax=Anastrepha ludens TaxID=28586 RepID=UPI0023B11828|nr:uncharacterized protein LOC128866890 [Anastrepha ludens]